MPAAADSAAVTDSGSGTGSEGLQPTQHGGGLRQLSMQEALEAGARSRGKVQIPQSLKQEMTRVLALWLVSGHHPYIAVENPFLAQMLQFVSDVTQQ